MPDAFIPPSPESRRRAFSLLELIATISIVAILMALAAPALLDAISTSRLTGSGDFLYNKLSQARQQAITDSRDIRVRIYAANEATGEKTARSSAAGPLPRSDGNFNRLQFLGWRKDGSDEILTDVFSLDEGVTISRSPALSSLISGLPRRGDAPSESEANPPSSYVEFAFHPDGSTNLPAAAVSPDDIEASTKWFLTVIQDSVATGEGTEESARPRNFYCIQIDPDTGGLTVYRP